MALGGLRRLKPPVKFNQGEIDRLVFKKIKKNPTENYNPFGVPVSEISLFVFGDTHFHPNERHNPDPNQNLPTTRALSFARRVLTGDRNWHGEILPNLHNQALAGWESAVRDLLRDNPALAGKNMAIIHTGDIAEDAVARPAMEESILVTQGAMKSIGENMVSSDESRALHFQALGDHDVDIRPWERGRIYEQTAWVYKTLGVETTPACYLQEIGQEGQKPDKAILILGTNLMEDKWVEIMSRESDELFKHVQKGIDMQEALIDQARNYNELIIIGHRPSFVLKIADRLRADSIYPRLTVFGGHRHFPYNSDKRGFPRPGDAMADCRGINIYIVGAASIGAGGIEVKRKKPVGYLLRINGNVPIAPALEVTPNL